VPAGRLGFEEHEMGLKIAITLLLVAVLVIPTIAVIRKRLDRRD
jgi:hypothetical protein